MASKKRPRAARRKRERDLLKLADAREKLARLSKGGSPDHPLSVVSASVVEATAQGLACARCEGEVAVEEHTAERGLRRVRTRCKRCSARRDVWIELASRWLS